MHKLVNPIQRDTLTNSVMHQIEQMILDGRISPGDWLPPQTELAEGFGVGLSTVREATRGLALMGILDPQAGRGTRVSTDAYVSLRMTSLVRDRLNDLEAKKIHETRCIIEVGITELAAKRATQGDIHEIERSLAHMEDVKDDDAAFVKADLEFHSAVAKASKNDLIEEIYQILLEMLSEVMDQIIRIPGLKDRGIQMQRRILKAIRARDYESARQLAEKNIVEWDAILQAPNSNGSQG